jgi:hypothetical protein
MPSDDRERSFENALARHLRPEGSRDICCDAEMLAAYHERSLAPEAMASLKGHVSECARCQEILAQIQATDEIPMVTADIVRPEEATAKSVVRIVPTRKATLWRLVAPAGALAAGLLVWIAVRENKPVPFVKSASTRDAASEVAKAEPASPPALPPTLEATRKGEAPSLRADSTSHAEPRMQSRLQPSADANREVGGAATQLVSPLTKEKELQSTRKKSSSAGGVGAGSLGAAPRFVTPSVPQRVLEPTPPRGVTESVAVEPAPSSEVKNQVTEAALAKTEPDAKSANEKRDAAASRSVSPMSAKASAAPPPAPASSPAPAPVPSQSQTVEVMSESAELKTLPMRGRDVSDLSTLNRNAQLLLASGSAAVTVTAPGGRVSWRIGAAGVILFSSDAGKTWLVQSSGIVTDLLAGSAPSPKVCWLVGRSGTILRTTDKGKHWKKVKPPTQDDLRSVFAVNARQATVSPATGTYQTTDGGATWNKLPPE